MSKPNYPAFQYYFALVPSRLVLKWSHRHEFIETRERRKVTLVFPPSLSIARVYFPPSLMGLTRRERNSSALVEFNNTSISFRPHFNKTIDLELVSDLIRKLTPSPFIPLGALQLFLWSARRRSDESAS